MRVLLDECVPKNLSRELVGHEVMNVRKRGWSGKANGELLSLAVAGGFEVVITVDRLIGDALRQTSAPISVVIMKAVSNRLEDLEPLVPAVLRAMDTIKVGTVVELGD